MAGSCALYSVASLGFQMEKQAPFPGVGFVSPPSACILIPLTCDKVIKAPYLSHWLSQDIFLMLA